MIVGQPIQEVIPQNRVAVKVNVPIKFLISKSVRIYLYLLNQEGLFEIMYFFLELVGRLYRCFTDFLMDLLCRL